MTEGTGSLNGSARPPNFLNPVLQIGDQYVEGRIDTGTQVSLVSSGLAQRLVRQGTCLDKGIPVPLLISANNTSLKIVGKIKENIDFFGHRLRFPFFVVRDLPVDILIGVDLLAHCEVRLNFASQEVAVGQLPFCGDVPQGTLEAIAALVPEHERHILTVLRRVQDVFRDKPGLTTIAEHKIKTGDARPIFQNPYPLSQDKLTEVRRLVEEMLEAGHIEASDSPWASPIVLVKKKNGKTRFCVDYRRVNNVTCSDRFPLPLISSIVQKVGQAGIWTTLDLASGYWQMRVASEDRPKTSFITPFGTFCYKVMPFGLKNAPASFQRLMNKVLSSCIGEFCEVYLDDIVVYSRDIQEHITHLEKVLSALQQAGLTLNVDKCDFFKSELEFLGHHFTRNGLVPQKSKVEAIQAYPIPRNVKSLRRFLGMCSWVKSFIPFFAEKAKPLYDLTRPSHVWKWDKRAQDSFKALRDALVKPPVLHFFRQDAPLQLYTDASETGLGAFLTQLIDGKEHALAYASRVLRPPEVNYTVSERECLAIVWACERFKTYFSVPVTVITDHSALTCLQHKKTLKGRLARWAIQLQEHPITIEYRRGRQLVVPDALSRAPVGVEEEQDFPEHFCFLVQGVEYSQLVRAQRQDPLYSNIYTYLKSGILPEGKASEVLGRSVQYTLENDILKYRKTDRNEWRTAVPLSLKPLVLQEFHDSTASGHLGFWKTYRKCMAKVFWPGMKSDIRLYIRSCQVCQKFKFAHTKKAGLLQSVSASAPGEMWGIDLIGPLPASTQGNTQCLVVVDYFSRWVELFALRRATARAIAAILTKDVFSRFGFPKYILSDNGPQFVSDLFRETCSKFGIQRKLASPYHPQTNRTERVNRTLGPMIAGYLKERHGRWDQDLQSHAFSLRTAVSEVTGFSPARLFLGRELALPWDSMVHGEAWKPAQDFVDILPAVKSNERKSQERQKRNYDRNRVHRTFQVGSLVWLRTHHLSSSDKHQTAKFMPKWEGPCKITEVLSDLVYRLVDIETGGQLGTHHVSDLKSYIEREEGDRNSPRSVCESESDEDLEESSKTLPIFQDSDEDQFDPFSNIDMVASGPSADIRLLVPRESEPLTSPALVNSIVTSTTEASKQRSKRPQRGPRIDYRKLAGLGPDRDLQTLVKHV